MSSRRSRYEIAENRGTQPRLRALLATVLFALAGPAPKAAGGKPRAAAPPAPPSILLVTIDTLRADHVGAYGTKDAETPNLDRIAREGILFEEARSHVPLTLPSHATILTGLLPPHNGVRANGVFRLAAGATTLASALRSRGYSTGAVVASVVLDRVWGLDRGFDLYDDNQRVGEKTAFDYLERGASQIADAARAAIPRLRPPFFLWVHLYDPHQPWVAPDAYRARHPSSGYDAEIAFADAALGTVRALAEERAGGRLIVAALSDHGESLGEHGENQHGYTLHRGVLRVPLLITGPGLPRGRRVVDPVGLVDVGPTLVDLVGASLPGADGRTLRPLWTERVAAQRSDPAGRASTDLALWEESLHPLYDSGWAPLRGILTPVWHFVDAPRPELYDRSADPDDVHDLASTRPEIVETLTRRLAALARSLGDTPEPAAPADDSPEAREQREKLASLGYLTTGAARGTRGRRLDPKDGLPGFRAVEDAEPLLEAGKGGEARALLEPFTKTDPGNPRIWHQLGRALSVAGQLDAAEDALRRALALDPQGDYIRYSYASLLRSKGNSAGARVQLEAILSRNPRAIDATLDLVSLAASSGEHERAESLLVASYAAGARDPDQLDLLGYYRLKKGAREEAARFFSEALALRPNDPPAILESARAALRGNETGRALDLLARCTEGTKAFECRMEMARALLAGPHDLAAARRQLEAARSVATDEKMRREVERRLADLDALGNPN